MAKPKLSQHLDVLLRRTRFRSDDPNDPTNHDTTTQPDGNAKYGTANANPSLPAVEPTLRPNQFNIFPGQLEPQPIPKSLPTTRGLECKSKWRLSRKPRDKQRGKSRRKQTTDRQNEWMPKMWIPGLHSRKLPRKWTTMLSMRKARTLWTSVPRHAATMREPTCHRDGKPGRRSAVSVCSKTQHTQTTQHKRPN